MNEEQGKFLEELYHANFKRMLLELYPILKDMPSAQDVYKRQSLDSRI